jgi:SAM-dependent methyltransferase
MTDLSRSARWHGVWNRRDPSIVGMNGWDGSCATQADYRDFASRVARIVAETLRLGSEDRIADLGCGTGVIAGMIAPQVRSVLAIDYSEHAIEVALSGQPAPNIHYRIGDLTRLSPSEVDVDKAYSVSVLHYLDEYAIARDLVRGLLDRGVEVLVMDVPDVRHRDRVARSYDIETYSHLYFDEELLRHDFPGVEILRGLLPGYPNDPVRFSFHVRPPARTGWRA